MFLSMATSQQEFGPPPHHSPENSVVSHQKNLCLPQKRDCVTGPMQRHIYTKTLAFSQFLTLPPATTNGSPRLIGRAANPSAAAPLALQRRPPRSEHPRVTPLPIASPRRPLASPHRAPPPRFVALSLAAASHPCAAAPWCCTQSRCPLQPQHRSTL